jgi:hypothetical protein
LGWRMGTSLASLNACRVQASTPRY